MLISIETLPNEGVSANHIGSDDGSGTKRTVVDSRRRKRKDGAGRQLRGTSNIGRQIRAMKEEIEDLKRTLREESEEVARLTREAMDVHRQVTEFNRNTVDFKSESVWDAMR